MQEKLEKVCPQFIFCWKLLFLFTFLKDVPDMKMIMREEAYFPRKTFLHFEFQPFNKKITKFSL
jgi:hypothetical protein